jgi:hypothetical protein
MKKSGGRWAGRVLSAGKAGWGGRREGAGRKPKGAFAGVAHGPRPTLGRRSPALVTLDLCPGLPDLRQARTARLLAEILSAADGRFGLRVLEHALQRDHLHLIVGARTSSEALTRGMQGLTVRIARGLNRLWRRSGPIFVDRFEARLLQGADEERAARRSPCAWRSPPDTVSVHRPSGCVRPRLRLSTGPSPGPRQGA